MSTANNLRIINQSVNRKSPEIFTGLGISGVIATAYLAAKATWRARGRLEAEQPHDNIVDAAKQNIPIVWDLYIPTFICGLSTITAIALSHRIESGRTAAAVSAYSLTEQAFTEYRSKVVEEIGKHKEQVVRDDIARDKVLKNGPDASVIIAGSGEVLCCELYTERYFMSSMEDLRRAVNDINMEINNQIYVTLEDFYDTIGLKHTSHSGELGWTSDKLLELEFSTVMTEDGRPCLAFQYNYLQPI